MMTDRTACLKVESSSGPTEETLSKKKLERQGFFSSYSRKKIKDSWSFQIQENFFINVFVFGKKMTLKNLFLVLFSLVLLSGGHYFPSFLPSFSSLGQASESVFASKNNASKENALSLEKESSLQNKRSSQQCSGIGLTAPELLAQQVNGKQTASENETVQGTVHSSTGFGESRQIESQNSQIRDGETFYNQMTSVPFVVAVGSTRSSLEKLTVPFENAQGTDNFSDGAFTDRTQIARYGQNEQFEQIEQVEKTNRLKQTVQTIQKNPNAQNRNLLTRKNVIQLVAGEKTIRSGSRSGSRFGSLSAHLNELDDSDDISSNTADNYSSVDTLSTDSSDSISGNVSDADIPNVSSPLSKTTPSKVVPSKTMQSKTALPKTALPKLSSPQTALAQKSSAKTSSNNTELDSTFGSSMLSEMNEDFSLEDDSDVAEESWVLENESGTEIETETKLPMETVAIPQENLSPNFQDYQLKESEKVPSILVQELDDSRFSEQTDSSINSQTGKQTGNQTKNGTKKTSVRQDNLSDTANLSKTVNSSNAVNSQNKKSSDSTWKTKKQEGAATPRISASIGSFSLKKNARTQTNSSADAQASDVQFGDVPTEKPQSEETQLENIQTDTQFLSAQSSEKQSAEHRESDRFRTDRFQSRSDVDTVSDENNSFSINADTREISVPDTNISDINSQNSNVSDSNVWETETQESGTQELGMSESDSAFQNSETVSDETGANSFQKSKNYDVQPTVEAAPEEELLVVHQSPVIDVQTRGPKKIIVGQISPYQIIVRNNSSVNAEQLTVVTEIPASIEISNLSPNAGSTNVVPNEDKTLPSNCVWTIGNLGADETKILTLNLVPKTRNNFELVSRYEFRQATLKADIEVQEPLLEISVDGHDTIEWGVEEKYRLRIRNTGNGDAENLRLTVTTGTSEQATQILKLLKAGEEKVMEMTIKTVLDDSIIIDVEASGSYGLNAQASKQVKILRGKIDLFVEAPEVQFVKNEIDYLINIRNTGTASLRNVEIAASIPSTVRYISCTGEGTPVSSKGQVVWNIDEIRPDQELEYFVKCELLREGLTDLAVQVVDDTGLTSFGEAQIQVESIASLNLKVKAPQGPVAVGKDVIYEVTVSNQGTKASADIQAGLFFVENLMPIEIASGEGMVYPEDCKVIFDKLNVLNAGQSITYKVKARAVSAGNHKVQAMLESVPSDIQLVSEEITYYYEHRVVAHNRQPSNIARVAMRPNDMGTSDSNVNNSGSKSTGSNNSDVSNSGSNSSEQNVSDTDNSGSNTSSSKTQTKADNSGSRSGENGTLRY